jgi:serine/threonine-protein kinase
MRYKQLFLLSALALQFVSAIAKNKPITWHTLSGENYSIQYPDIWKIDTSGKMGSAFIIITPLEPETDKFRENINLVVQDLKTKTDLGQFTATSVKQINTYITKAKIISNQTMDTEAGTFQKLVYTGDQGKFHLKFVQYCFVKDNKAYVLTFTAEQHAFTGYELTAEQVLESFRIAD